MRIAMILPGLGRVRRGAEAAFLELTRHLTQVPGVRVTLFGSGEQGVDGSEIRQVPCRPRERFEGWPRIPCLRSENHYEELSFAWNLARSGLYRPADFDLVLTCTYPHINWFLQWIGRRGGPKIVFATQNGDWMCRSRAREFRWFRCDALVCTNPVYFEAHRRRFRAALIPNGVDVEEFRPRDRDRGFPGHVVGPIPAGRRVVLMSTALIPPKRVAEGIRAVARVPDAFLVVAGDGPGRDAMSALARDLLPDRHRLLGSVARERMPELYRSADAFLHLCTDEPFGIVYLEAAASGLPMVVHDGEVPRWILGPSAFYADANDPDAVARGLAQALDPTVGGRVGAEARGRVAADWTWREQARSYLDFFREILGDRPSAPLPGPRDRASARGLAHS